MSTSGKTKKVKIQAHEATEAEQNVAASVVNLEHKPAQHERTAAAFAANMLLSNRQVHRDVLTTFHELSQRQGSFDIESPFYVVFKQMIDFFWTYAATSPHVGEILYDCTHYGLTAAGDMRVGLSTICTVVLYRGLTPPTDSSDKEAVLEFGRRIANKQYTMHSINLLFPTADKDITENVKKTKEIYESARLNRMLADATTELRAYYVDILDKTGSLGVIDKRLVQRAKLQGTEGLFSFQELEVHGALPLLTGRDFSLSDDGKTLKSLTSFHQDVAPAELFDVHLRLSIPKNMLGKLGLSFIPFPAVLESFDDPQNSEIVIVVVSALLAMTLGPATLAAQFVPLVKLDAPLTDEKMKHDASLSMLAKTLVLETGLSSKHINDFRDFVTHESSAVSAVDGAST